MCLSTPKLPEDTSAQQAQVANDQRQAKITEGQGAIDSAFTKYDDNFFNGYQKNYVDNYNPQVDEQFGRAKEKLGYNDARRGMQDSTSGIFNRDLLNDSYGKQRQQIGANGVQAAEGLRSDVASQKSNLYALNASAADPTLISERASAAAGTIPSTPQYSVLGDLFSGLVNSGAAYQAGQSKALPPGYAAAFAPGAGLPGSGSGRVVR